MPVSFTCPHCQLTTVVADQYVGQSGPCSGCAQTVTVVNSPNAQFTPTSEGADSAAVRMLIPVGRSGWAIAAGYLGLLSFLIFPAPFAVLFGILGVRDVRRNPDLHGMGRSVFGIVMGLLGTVFLLFGIAVAILNA